MRINFVLVLTSLFISILSAADSQPLGVGDSAFSSVGLSRKAVIEAEVLNGSLKDSIVADIEGMTSKARVDALRNLSGLRSNVVSLVDRLDVSSDAMRDDMSLINEKIVRVTEEQDIFSRGELEYLESNLQDAIVLAEEIREFRAKKPQPSAPAEEIARYETEAASLERRINETDFISRARSGSGDQLFGNAQDVLFDSFESEIESTIRRKEFLERRFNELTSEKITLDGNLKELSQQIEVADTMRSELSSMLMRLDTYGATLLQAKLDDSDYTKWVTGMFSLLVLIVIIGFYILAFKSEDVQKQIFSGDRGIQFITLFSLVIAIILFGVLGILEGKELSALLGGLSGYILGRGSRGEKDDGAGSPVSQSTGNPPSFAPVNTPVIGPAGGPIPA